MINLEDPKELNPSSFYNKLKINVSNEKMLNSIVKLHDVELPPSNISQRSINSSIFPYRHHLSLIINNFNILS